MSDNPCFRLNFSQLEYFISAAKHLNFSKAAAECYVVPNVISKQISNLESMLHFQLFRRESKRLQLTAEGEIFYRCAMDISRRFEGAVHEMASLDPSLDMRLLLGYYDIWSETMIAPLVRNFKARYPNSHVSIRHIHPPQVITSLNNGTLDAVIISPYRERKGGTLDSFLLAHSPVNLVVASGHSLSGRPEVSLNEVESQLFSHLTIMPDVQDPKTSLNTGDPIMPRRDKFYALGLEQSKNIHNILFNIRSGISIGLMPEACKDYLENLGLRFVKIKEPIDPVTMHVLWKKDNPSATLKLFLEITHSYVAGQEKEVFL